MEIFKTINQASAKSMIWNKTSLTNLSNDALKRDFKNIALVATSKQS